MRSLEHLELASWGQALARQKQPGRGSQPARSKLAHATTILGEAEVLSGQLATRVAQPIPGIKPSLVFKIAIHQDGHMQDSDFRSLGLHVVARDSRTAIVVFPDDASLQSLRSRVRQYGGIRAGHKYDFVASIESLSAYGRSDRLGAMLKAEPIPPGETLPVDVELWRLGNDSANHAKLDELTAFVTKRHGRITDTYVGDSVLARAIINQLLLDQILEIDYVREIDRRPRPTFEMRDIVQADLEWFDPPTQATSALPMIIVLDSGVAQRHPLIGPALGDAQSFPPSLGEPNDTERRHGGHGTAVCGLAIYNDVGACLATREFRPTAGVLCGRVLDDDCAYDEELLVESQLRTAVTYFVDNYPAAHVVNLSLGADTSICSDSSRQLRLAAAIDELAYELRERDVVFVVSAGNYRFESADVATSGDRFSSSLLAEPKARVIDPATSAISLTVGGLSYGAGSPLSSQLTVDAPIAGQREWPSPFTRTGWGLSGGVKPDLVDFAGDTVIGRGRLWEQPAFAGMPTLARDFAPPSGRLFRTVAGTSYATPRVANLAARLFEAFPFATANLVRALIADSARVPSNRPPDLVGRASTDDDVLRMYGYGRPEFERARWSGANEVLLVSEDEIELDKFKLYTIPSVPDEFVTARGTGRISVTLAFDPPTRRTRGDSYLGISMHFFLYRNTTAPQVEQAIRQWTRDEIETLGTGRPRRGDLSKEEIDLKPGVRRRGVSTLQRATRSVERANWRLEPSPLTLAVLCQRNWAPREIVSQRYAIVVSIEHENPAVNLYQRIAQHARVYQRARIRV